MTATAAATATGWEIPHFGAKNAFDAMRPLGTVQFAAKIDAVASTSMTGFFREIKIVPEYQKRTRAPSAGPHARRASLCTPIGVFRNHTWYLCGLLAGVHIQRTSSSKVAAAARRQTPDARARTACLRAQPPRRKGHDSYPMTTSPCPMATSPRGRTSIVIP